MQSTKQNVDEMVKIDCKNDGIVDRDKALQLIDRLLINVAGYAQPDVLAREDIINEFGRQLQGEDFLSDELKRRMLIANSRRMPCKYKKQHTSIFIHCSVGDVLFSVMRAIILMEAGFQKQMAQRALLRFLRQEQALDVSDGKPERCIEVMVRIVSALDGYELGRCRPDRIAEYVMYDTFKVECKRDGAVDREGAYHAIDWLVMNIANHKDRTSLPIEEIFSKFTKQTHDQNWLNESIKRRVLNADTTRVRCFYKCGQNDCSTNKAVSIPCSVKDVLFFVMRAIILMEAGFQKQMAQRALLDFLDQEQALDVSDNSDEGRRAVMANIVSALDQCVLGCRSLGYKVCRDDSVSANIDVKDSAQNNTEHHLKSRAKTAVAGAEIEVNAWADKKADINYGGGRIMRNERAGDPAAARPAVSSSLFLSSIRPLAGRAATGIDKDYTHCFADRSVGKAFHQSSATRLQVNSLTGSTLASADHASKIAREVTVLSITEYHKDPFKLLITLERIKNAMRRVRHDSANVNLLPASRLARKTIPAEVLEFITPFNEVLQQLQLSELVDYLGSKELDVIAWALNGGQWRLVLTLLLMAANADSSNMELACISLRNISLKGIDRPRTFSEIQQWVNGRLSISYGTVPDSPAWFVRLMVDRFKPEVIEQILQFTVPVERLEGFLDEHADFPNESISLSVAAMLQVLSSKSAEGWHDVFLGLLIRELLARDESPSQTPMKDLSRYSSVSDRLASHGPTSKRSMKSGSIQHKFKNLQDALEQCIKFNCYPIRRCIQLKAYRSAWRLLQCAKGRHLDEGDSTLLVSLLTDGGQDTGYQNLALAVQHGEKGDGRYLELLINGYASLDKQDKLGKLTPDQGQALMRAWFSCKDAGSDKAPFPLLLVNTKQRELVINCFALLPKRDSVIASFLLTVVGDAAQGQDRNYAAMRQLLAMCVWERSGSWPGNLVSCGYASVLQDAFKTADQELLSILLEPGESLLRADQRTRFDWLLTKHDKLLAEGACRACLAGQLDVARVVFKHFSRKNASGLAFTSFWQSQMEQFGVAGWKTARQNPEAFCYLAEVMTELGENGIWLAAWSRQLLVARNSEGGAIEREDATVSSGSGPLWRLLTQSKTCSLATRVLTATLEAERIKEEEFELWWGKEMRPCQQLLEQKQIIEWINKLKRRKKDDFRIKWLKGLLAPRRGRANIGARETGVLDLSKVLEKGVDIPKRERGGSRLARFSCSKLQKSVARQELGAQKKVGAPLAVTALESSKERLNWDRLIAPASLKTSRAESKSGMREVDPAGKGVDARQEGELQRSPSLIVMAEELGAYDVKVESFSDQRKAPAKGLQQSQKEWKVDNPVARTADAPSNPSSKAQPRAASRRLSQVLPKTTAEEESKMVAKEAPQEQRVELAIAPRASRTIEESTKRTTAPSVNSDAIPLETPLKAAKAAPNAAADNQLSGTSLAESSATLTASSATNLTATPADLSTDSAITDFHKQCQQGCWPIIAALHRLIKNSGPDQEIKGIMNVLPSIFRELSESEILGLFSKHARSADHAITGQQLADLWRYMLEVRAWPMATYWLVVMTCRKDILPQSSGLLCSMQRGEKYAGSELDRELWRKIKRCTLANFLNLAAEILTPQSMQALYEFKRFGDHCNLLTMAMIDCDRTQQDKKTEVLANNYDKLYPVNSEYEQAFPVHQASSLGWPGWIKPDQVSVRSEIGDIKGIWKHLRNNSQAMLAMLDSCLRDGCHPLLYLVRSGEKEGIGMARRMLKYCANLVNDQLLAQGQQMINDWYDLLERAAEPSSTKSGFALLLRLLDVTEDNARLLLYPFTQGREALRKLAIFLVHLGTELSTQDQQSVLLFDALWMHATVGKFTLLEYAARYLGDESVVFLSAILQRTVFVQAERDPGSMRTFALLLRRFSEQAQHLLYRRLFDHCSVGRQCLAQLLKVALRSDSGFGYNFQQFWKVMRYNGKLASKQGTGQPIKPGESWLPKQSEQLHELITMPRVAMLETICDLLVAGDERREKGAVLRWALKVAPFTDLLREYAGSVEGEPQLERLELAKLCRLFKSLLRIHPLLDVARRDVKLYYVLYGARRMSSRSTESELQKNLNKAQAWFERLVDQCSGANSLSGCDIGASSVRPTGISVYGGAMTETGSVTVMREKLAKQKVGVQFVLLLIRILALATDAMCSNYGQDLLNDFVVNDEEGAYWTECDGICVPHDHCAKDSVSANAFDMWLGGKVLNSFFRSLKPTDDHFWQVEPGELGKLVELADRLSKHRYPRLDASCEVSGSYSNDTHAPNNNEHTAGELRLSELESERSEISTSGADSSAANNSEVVQSGASWSETDISSYSEPEAGKSEMGNSASGEREITESLVSEFTAGELLASELEASELEASELVAENAPKAASSLTASLDDVGAEQVGHEGDETAANRAPLKERVSLSDEGDSKLELRAEKEEASDTSKASSSAENSGSDNEDEPGKIDSVSFHAEYDALAGEEAAVIAYEDASNVYTENGRDDDEAAPDASMSPASSALDASTASIGVSDEDSRPALECTVEQLDLVGRPEQERVTKEEEERREQEQVTKEATEREVANRQELERAAQEAERLEPERWAGELIEEVLGRAAQEIDHRKNARLVRAVVDEVVAGALEVANRQELERAAQEAERLEPERAAEQLVNNALTESIDVAKQRELEGVAGRLDEVFADTSKIIEERELDCLVGQTVEGVNAESSTRLQEQMRLEAASMQTISLGDTPESALEAVPESSLESTSKFASMRKSSSEAMLDPAEEEQGGDTPEIDSSVESNSINTGSELGELDSMDIANAQAANDALVGKDTTAAGNGVSNVYTENGRDDDEAAPDASMSPASSALDASTASIGVSDEDSRPALECAVEQLDLVGRPEQERVTKEEEERREQEQVTKEATECEVANRQELERAAQEAERLESERAAEQLVNNALTESIDVAKQRELEGAVTQLGDVVTAEAPGRVGVNGSSNDEDVASQLLAGRLENSELEISGPEVGGAGAGESHDVLGSARKNELEHTSEILLDSATEASISEQESFLETRSQEESFYETATSDLTEEEGDVAASEINLSIDDSSGGADNYLGDMAGTDVNCENNAASIAVADGSTDNANEEDDSLQRLSASGSGNVDEMGTGALLSCSEASSFAFELRQEVVEAFGQRAMLPQQLSGSNPKEVQSDKSSSVSSNEECSQSEVGDRSRIENLSGDEIGDDVLRDQVSDQDNDQGSDQCDTVCDEPFDEQIIGQANKEPAEPASSQSSGQICVGDIITFDAQNNEVGGVSEPNEQIDGQSQQQERVENCGLDTQDSSSLCSEMPREEIELSDALSMRSDAFSLRSGATASSRIPDSRTQLLQCVRRGGFDFESNRGILNSDTLCVWLECKEKRTGYNLLHCLSIGMNATQVMVYTDTDDQMQSASCSTMSIWSRTSSAKSLSGAEGDLQAHREQLSKLIDWLKEKARAEYRSPNCQLAIFNALIEINQNSVPKQRSTLLQHGTPLHLMKNNAKLIDCYSTLLRCSGAYLSPTMLVMVGREQRLGFFGSALSYAELAIFFDDGLLHRLLVEYQLLLQDLQSLRQEDSAPSVLQMSSDSEFQMSSDAERLDGTGGDLLGGEEDQEENDASPKPYVLFSQLHKAFRDSETSWRLNFWRRLASAPTVFFKLLKIINDRRSDESTLQGAMSQLVRDLSLNESLDGISQISIRAIVRDLRTQFLATDADGNNLMHIFVRNIPSSMTSSAPEDERLTPLKLTGVLQQMGWDDLLWKTMLQLNYKLEMPAALWCQLDGEAGFTKAQLTALKRADFAKLSQTTFLEVTPSEQDGSIELRVLKDDERLAVNVSKGLLDGMRKSNLEFFKTSLANGKHFDHISLTYAALYRYAQPDLILSFFGGKMDAMVNNSERVSAIFTLARLMRLTTGTVIVDANGNTWAHYLLANDHIRSESCNSVLTQLVHHAEGCLRDSLVRDYLLTFNNEGELPIGLKLVEASATSRIGVCKCRQHAGMDSRYADAMRVACGNSCEWEGPGQDAELDKRMIDKWEGPGQDAELDKQMIDKAVALMPNQAIIRLSERLWDAGFAVKVIKACFAIGEINGRLKGRIVNSINSAASSIGQFWNGLKAELCLRSDRGWKLDDMPIFQLLIFGKLSIEVKSELLCAILGQSFFSDRRQQVLLGLFSWLLDDRFAQRGVIFELLQRSLGGLCGCLSDRRNVRAVIDQLVDRRLLNPPLLEGVAPMQEYSELLNKLLGHGLSVSDTLNHEERGLCNKILQVWVQWAACDLDDEHIQNIALLAYGDKVKVDDSTILGEIKTLLGMLRESELPAMQITCLSKQLFGIQRCIKHYQNNNYQPLAELLKGNGGSGLRGALAIGRGAAQRNASSDPKKEHEALKEWMGDGLFGAIGELLDDLLGRQVSRQECERNFDLLSYGMQLICGCCSGYETVFEDVARNPMLRLLQFAHNYQFCPSDRAWAVRKVIELLKIAIKCDRERNADSWATLLLPQAVAQELAKLHKVGEGIVGKLFSEIRPAKIIKLLGRRGSTCTWQPDVDPAFTEIEDWASEQEQTANRAAVIAAEDGRHVPQHHMPAWLRKDRRPSNDDDCAEHNDGDSTPGMGM